MGLGIRFDRFIYRIIRLKKKINNYLTIIRSSYLSLSLRLSIVRLQCFKTNLDFFFLKEVYNWDGGGAANLTTKCPQPPC